MTDRIAFAGDVSVEGRRLKGAVLLKDQRTPRNGEMVAVDPAALIKADASKAFASMEHDDSRLLGFTGNATLTINRTEDGFTWETADLPNTSYANDAIELVRGGYISGSSFEIEGLRSTFTTDLDGTRVRTYTGIKQFLSVSPVRDPAFPSMAAAFRKEPDVSDKETNPPEPEPPTPPEEPKPKFTEQPKSGKAEWQKFAKDITTGQIEATLDQLMAASKGDLRGPDLDRYEGFAAELQDRKRVDADVQSRIEQVKFRHDAIRGLIRKAPEAELFASDDYKEAFGRFLRTGDNNIMEQFAGQSIAGSGAEGGYTVPQDFRNIIIETKKAYGGIQGVADSIETGDGRDLPWPTNDDTANSAAVATEGSAVGSGGADLVFAQEILQAFTYDATGASNNPLAVSKELLQDSAFDVEAFVGRKLGQRLGRKMAADYGNGTGSSQPFGLFAKTPDTMTATAMYPALVEHHFQVDQAYRDSGNCRWVLGDTILAKIWASTDTTKRPLYTPMDASGGQSAPSGMLLGYPVTLDQSSASNVAFGDIAQGFIIRNVRSIQVDVDPYTLIKSRQIAFHAWARTDSAVQDSAAYSVSSYSGVSADS